MRVIAGWRSYYRDQLRAAGWLVQKFVTDLFTRKTCEKCAMMIYKGTPPLFQGLHQARGGIQGMNSWELVIDVA